MIRFAFITILLLSAIGCQTAAQRPKPTFVAHAPQAAQQFWHKTARLLQSTMSDTGKQNVESNSHVAALHYDSDIFPVNRSSHALYKAGSMFSPFLIPLEQEEIEQEETEQAEIIVAADVPKPKPQTEDSETPKNLSKNMEAPLPDETLVAAIKRPARSPAAKQEIEWEEIEEDFYDEPRPVIKRTLSNRKEQIVAQSSIPLAAPIYPSLTQLPHAAPGMVQASYQQSVPPYVHNVPGQGNVGYGAGDWQTPARQTIEQLRYAIEQTPNGRTQTNEMRLRMLETLLGNKVEAAKPMQSADNMLNNFMGHQILGLATLLDDSIQDNRGRYISAAYRFNEGLAELQNLCPLKLKKVIFVDNFFYYGQYISHPTCEFRAGEKFLIYVELENPTARKVDDGFEVRVAISYEIRDANAAIVDKQDADNMADKTLSRKRDYHLGIANKLPSTLQPGQYQLRINITDLNDDSMQYAAEQIPFRIIPALAGE